MQRGEDYRDVLAAAADLTEITQIVRSAARAVTGCAGRDVRAARGRRRTPDRRSVAELQELAALTAEAVARVGLESAPWAPTFVSQSTG